MDYSLTNQKVQAYLSGDDSNPPISEFIYLHTHPLIRPNFLNEIEELVIKAGQHIKDKNIKTHHVNRMVNIAISIGTKMPTFDEESAPLILKEIRDLYNICNQIIEMQ